MYAVYKKLTSNIMMAWVENEKKRDLMQIFSKKKGGIAVLSEKMWLQSKENYQKQRGTSYNEKWLIHQKRHSRPKGSKQQNSKIYEPKHQNWKRKKTSPQLQ